MEFLNGMQRSNMCGEIDKTNVGKSVTLMGWVARRRDLGGLIFIQLRDRSGICQIVFDSIDTDKTLFDKASTLRQEYVIAVIGTVRLRTANNINTNMKTGEVEVVADKLLILNQAETPPFAIGDTQASEMLRLKYRYLDLRRPELQQRLITRSLISQLTRNYLSAHNFIEVETPFLGKSTPEGARDYLVPSRVQEGKFYALPQSPQLYKQLLMIGGFDRYFQIVKCFRDEDLRANRQPEFTQIDIEMSFIDNENDLMTIIEGMICSIFDGVKGIKLTAPFKRLPYNTAMNDYGSDKPDLRFEMKLIDISDCLGSCGFAMFDSAINCGGSVRAIVLNKLEDKISRKELDRLTEFVKTYKAKGLMWYALNNEGVRSSIAKQLSQQTQDAIISKLNLTKGDIALIVSDSDNEIVYNSLGALRVEIAEKYNLINNSNYAITWVTDFPLFEFDSNENRFVAKHHPFTSPKDDDIELMRTNPAAVRAKAYDLVINGQEAGGGSLRIYNKQVQTLMFETLGFTEQQINDRFGFFVNAFNYGTPPHGGIAFGLDRLVMLLTDTDNIKEVIAFPKVQNASCLMTEAPGIVEDKQLRELSIKVDINE